MEYVKFFYMTSLTMVLCLLMQHHFLFCFREVRKLFYAIHHFFTMIGALLLSGILFLIGYTVLQKAKENSSTLMKVFAFSFNVVSDIIFCQSVQHHKRFASDTLLSLRVIYYLSKIINYPFLSPLNFEVSLTPVILYFWCY